MTEHNLTSRTRLPDALRVLVEELPRETWETHSNYSGLISFWLDRHLMFRRLMQQMDSDAQLALDRQISVPDYARRLARYGNMLVNDLHMHHMIEDQQYFPLLQRQDARVAHGFDILDKDHHAIDEVLHGFAEAANPLLSDPENEAAGLDRTATVRTELGRMSRLLDRHLTDEEELVVPVLLKYAPAGMY